MSIRKRLWTTNGETRSAWIVDYTDQRRKRHQKTFRTKKEAEAFRDRMAVEVRQGLHVPDRDTVTVAEAASQWINSCKSDNLERSTVEAYQSILDNHILPLIGHVKLSSINVPFVTRFKDELRDTKYPEDFSQVRMRGKTRSAAVIKRAIMALGALLSDAQVRGTVVRNAVHEMSGHKRGRAKGVQRHKRILQVGIDIPTNEEIRLILLSCPPAYRLILMILAFTGMRISELRGLSWANVDLERATIRVRQRADRFSKMGAPKSLSGHRDIPIPPGLVRELLMWKAHCPASHLNLVFPTANGKIQNYQNIQKRGFQAAQLVAGISVDTGKKGKDGRSIMEAKYSGLHTLRHWFASWCINRRVDGGLELPAKLVQQRVGHSSIQVTMDTYGHLFPSTDDNALLEAAEGKLLMIPDATKLRHGRRKQGLEIALKPEK